MGNPSDGYHGKTIPFSLANFSARVKVFPNALYLTYRDLYNNQLLENIPVSLGNLIKLPSL